MLEELKVLVEVQGIDARIHLIEGEKARLPRMVALAGEELKAAEAASAEAKAALDAANKEKVDLDIELKSEGEHLRKLKLRSTEIKTNKEYFAHLKEIEDCQKKIGGLEERAIELMEKVEGAEAALKTETEKLEEERSRFSENKARIEKRFEAGDAELGGLVKRRDELMGEVSRDSALYYRQILKMFPDSAVVEAANGSCTGCRMTIPPQVFQNVRKGEAIIKCNNCRRILYYKET